MIKSFHNYSNSNIISNNNIKTVKKKKLIPICRVYSKDDFINEKLLNKENENKENLKNSLNYESLNIQSYQVHKIDKNLKTMIKNKLNKMNLSQKHKLRIRPKYSKNYLNNNNINNTNKINNNLKNINKNILPNNNNKENKIPKENFNSNNLQVKKVNYIANNYMSNQFMKKSGSFQLNKNSFRKTSKDKIKSKEKNKSNQSKNLKNNNYSDKSGNNISTKDKSISLNKRSKSLKNKIYTIKEINPFNIKSKSKTNRINNSKNNNNLNNKNKMKTTNNSNLCSFNKINKKLLTNKKINLKTKTNILNKSNNNCNYKYKTNSNSSLTLKNIKNEDENIINDIENKIKEIKISNNINKPQNFINIFPILNPFPQFVSEYSEEIYKNLLIDEKKFISSQIIDFLYMNNQEQINQEMRSILINWLIEVQDKFNYTEQTLFLCISLIDRYSSFKKILRSEYQLVGIASLFIACKHEEIELPNSKDFLFITENAYTKEELFNMEYKILKPINFEILTSTQYDFLLSFCNKFKFNQNEINFGKYLLNLTLLDYDLLKYSNSIIANSCAILSKKYFDKNYNKLNELYNKELYNESLVEEAVLINCIKDVWDLYLNFNKGEYINTRNKFMREKFGNIVEIIEKNES